MWTAPGQSLTRFAAVQSRKVEDFSLPRVLEPVVVVESGDMEGLAEPQGRRKL